MEDLARETVNLAILEGKMAMYVEKIDSTEVIRADIRVGRSSPAYVTGLGRAILAFLPRERVISMFEDATFIPFTASTLRNIDELLVDIYHIRQKGCALDDEEFIQGLARIAVPIINNGEDPLAAISISYPRYRCKSGCSKELRIRDLVLGSARSLSEEFGFRSYRETLSK